MDLIVQSMFGSMRSMNTDFIIWIVTRELAGLGAFFSLAIPSVTMSNSALNSSLIDFSLVIVIDNFHCNNLGPYHHLTRIIRSCLHEIWNGFCKL